jgi:hypothetical protein
MSYGMIRAVQVTDAFEAMLQGNSKVIGWAGTKQIVHRRVVRKMRLACREQNASVRQPAHRFPDRMENADLSAQGRCQFFQFALPNSARISRLELGENEKQRAKAKIPRGHYRDGPKNVHILNQVEDEGSSRIHECLSLIWPDMG